MKTHKSNKNQVSIKTQKQQHKYHKTQVNCEERFHKPYASPSPDKNSCNQISQTTAPCKQIEDFMNQKKRLKTCVQLDQLQISLNTYTHSYDAQVFYHQDFNKKKNNTTASYNEKNKTSSKHYSPHKLKKTKNIQTSIKKVVKDKIHQIKMNSSYNKSWQNHTHSVSFSQYENSRQINNNSHNQSQEQEISYLRRELQRYQQYVQQYKYLADKNKRLQQTMQKVLLQLEQNKGNTIYKDPLSDLYRTQDSVQAQQGSERTLKQQDFDNINRRIQQYEDQIDELIHQNERLVQEKLFFQRKFIQLETTKAFLNGSKLQIQSLANRLTCDFQNKLTKYDYELDQKIQCLQQKFNSALSVINKLRQQIEILEQQNHKKTAQNDYLTSFIDQLKYKQGDRSSQKQKIYQSKKKSSSSSLKSINSKSSQKVQTEDNKFRQILKINLAEISQAFNNNDAILEHPSQYDQDQKYQRSQLQKQQSYVLYKSSDFKKKNPFLTSLGSQPTLANLTQYKSERHIQTTKLQPSLMNIQQPETQKSVEKSHNSSLSFANQQIRLNSREDFIYIDDQDYNGTLSNKSDEASKKRSLELQNPNDESSNSFRLNSKDTNTLCYSYEKGQFAQILRENLQMRNQLQKIDEQYRLQLAINQQITDNIRKLEQQLQKMERERNSYIGSDQQRICYGKKAFNEIKDQIHTLDFQLQEHHKYLGSCLQSPHLSLNSKDQRIKDLQNDKEYLISQISDLKQTITQLRTKGQDTSFESTFDKKSSSLQKRRSATPINPFSQIKDEQSIDQRYQETQKRILSVFEAIDLQKTELI